MTDSEKLPADLPLEVDNRQVEQYIYDLVGLTAKDNIIARYPYPDVPPEAVDFIGEGRVIMNKKIQSVFLLSQKMVDGFNDPNNIPKLNESIKTLVSASAEPAQSMALISRIWKYLEYNHITPFDPKEYRLSPTTFLMDLERYAREHHLPPFTQAEKHDLFSAINDWKQGKPPTEILNRIGYSIEAASHRASFPTRAARQYAKNRGIDRAALSRAVQHLHDIKDYLEKLFQKK